MSDQRNLDEWDAEIEAEFQRVLGADKQAAVRKRGRRHVGFPWAFLVDACRLTEGRATLIVALYIYRRTKVCGSLTVTLPAANSQSLALFVDAKTKRWPNSKPQD
jgi:hypothetical protein